MFNRSVNKVVLVGNLGKDPEMRYTQNGGAVANFSIATTESWKNKQTGEYENKSEWHNIVVFGKFGEMVGQYLKKGAKVYVEGKLQTNKWQGQDGQDRYKTEIIANDIQMLDARNASQGQGQSSNRTHCSTTIRWLPKSERLLSNKHLQQQQSWGNAPQHTASATSGATNGSCLSTSASATADATSSTTSTSTSTTSTCSTTPSSPTSSTTASTCCV